MFPEVYKPEKDHFSDLYFHAGRWLAQIFTDFISKASNTLYKIIFKINTCTAMFIMTFKCSFQISNWQFWILQVLPN